MKKMISKTTQGYLKIKLVENNNTRRKLNTIELDKHTYYILGGTYFSPFASSLVKDNHVDGMKLYTTRSVFQNYVNSIPTLVVQNVGIPIGFIFSLEEDIPIYTDF